MLIRHKQGSYLSSRLTIRCASDCATFGSAGHQVLMMSCAARRASATAALHRSLVWGNYIGGELAMLRITINDAEEERRIVVEGKLAGPWVNVLEKCWEKTLAASQ